MTELHSSVYKIDSTKIKECKSCPRRFMYRYVFGWESTLRTRNDLEFGRAWHSAQEFLASHGYSPNAVQQAMEVFMKDYRQDFDEETDDMFPKKNPSRALEALMFYTSKWSDDFDKYDSLYSEVAGRVNIHPEMAPLYFRIDWVVRNKQTGKVEILERKTASNMNDNWKDQFLLSAQIGTYSHVGYSMYDEGEFDCVTVDGVQFSKKRDPFVSQDFQRIRVERSKDQMQVWLWNTIFWMDFIHEELEQFKQADPNASILECFPMNEENCSQWFGCAYKPLCISWPNPKKYFEMEPELGFQRAWWDPELEFENVKHKVEV